MKKIITLVFASVLLCFSLSAQSERIVNFDIALTTGIPVHNTKMDEPKSDLLLSTSFKRVITGFDADVVFNVTEPLKVMVGADTFCEFIWEKGKHYNSLDYSFYSGVKLFPNLAGFNASVCYVLGSRADFFKTEEDGKHSDNTAWGNGFRVALEYDFFYGEDTAVSPIVGGYYRFMPRGNYAYDHIISAYVGLRF